MTTSTPPATAEDANLPHGWRPRGPRSSLERGQWGVLACLILLTAGAWLLTIRQAQSMDMPMGVVARDAGEAPAMPGSDDSMASMGGDAMADAGDMAAAGMAGAGWSIAGLAAFVVAWTVMMAAMMFPAAAPMVLLYRTIATQRRAGGAAFAPTWVFVAGYLLVWAGVGVITWALVQWLSDLVGDLGTAQPGTWAPLALGAVLIVAGLYQLTPLKRVCLEHCRSPFAFMMQHWRDGSGGALRMGITHGAYCLGCCWALFAVLAAAGVMSLAWMLVLTLVIFVEKVMPFGPRAAHIVGIGFLVFGVAVASRVVAFPWMS